MGREGKDTMRPKWEYETILRRRHIELCLMIEPAGPYTPQVRTSGFFHARGNRGLNFCVPLLEDRQ